MSLIERIEAVQQQVLAQTLDGKSSVAHHLERGSVRLQRAFAEDEPQEADDVEAVWREAINEIRCALEHMFVAMVRSIASARQCEPLEQERPAAVRDRLVAFGIIKTVEERKLIERIYGIGSEKSAHPGFADNIEAEHRIGVMIETMRMALSRFEAALQRGFALPAEDRDHDREAKRLAQMLVKQVARHPSFTSQVLADENGVRQVTSVLRPGERPLDVKLYTTNASVAKLLRRAIEHAEPMTLNLNGEGGNQLDVTLDPRLRDLLGEAMTLRAVELVPSSGRAVRLVAGEGSIGDVPHAQMWLLRLRDGTGRLLLRSRLLSHALYFDQRHGASNVSFRMERTTNGSAAAHMLTMRLLKAALSSNLVIVRSLPEDSYLAALPLGQIARQLPSHFFSEDVITWYSLLARVEQALGIEVSPDAEWTAAHAVAVHQIDELFSKGSTEVDSRLELRVDGPGARRIATNVGDGHGVLTYHTDGPVFGLPAGPVSAGLVQLQMTAIETTPPPSELAVMPDNAEETTVVLWSKRPSVLRRITHLPNMADLDRMPVT